jgi:hypothetical protein
MVTLVIKIRMKLKNLFASDNPNLGQTQREETEFCCGKHAICKKNLTVVCPSLNLNESYEYYDDEELDIFKDRSPISYTEEETKQFVEIFRTMWESDIPGWLISLRLRGIELPVSFSSIINKRLK